MASPIQPLLNTINKKGVVLPNKYKIDVIWPKKIQLEPITKEWDNELMFRATEVNLAGRNLASFPEVNIYGPVREVVEGVTYAEEISVSFLDTRTLEIRRYFETWQEMCFNNDDDRPSWDLGYYNDYIGGLDIEILGQYPTGYYSVYGIRCFEVYPKSLGPIPLSSAPTTTPIQTQVSFSFRYWKTIDYNAGSKGSG